MYAVFVDGSRQYRVGTGDRVKVDYRDVEVGSDVTFKHVILVSEGESLQIGQPVVAGFSVVAEVIDHPTTKTRIQKFRRRKNYRRHTGHTQPYTMVRIKSIANG